MSSKEPTSPKRILLITVLVGMVIAVPIVSFADTASAQEQLDIGINAPSEAVTGEPVAVSASISIPNLVGSYESEISIVFSVDGDQVATKSATVQDGDTTTVSFAHTFSSSGTHTITVESELKLGGRTFSNSASRTIDITAPETAVPTTKETTSNREQTTVEGAAFSTPESLKDEIKTYREQAPLELPGNAFVLGTQDDLYLVFTQTEPKKGLATVTGVTPGKDISVQGQSFTVLAASSTSFRMDGDPTTVGDVTEDPEAHQLDLVQIQANHRRVSTLTDTDQGNDPTVALSTGVLTENPTKTTQMFTNPGQQATSLVLNASSDELGSNGQEKASSLLNVRSTNLVTVDFETRFWADTEATVDGIVLTPGSEARAFVTAFDRRNIIPAGPNQPLLYVVDSTTDSTKFESVSTLNAEATDGDVVSLRANVYGQTFSVQETLEHSTSCGQEVAQVPSPSGPICVDIVQDTLIHTGVAWTAVPDSQDDILLIVGLSSQEMDTPTETLSGEYRIVGEVYSTSRVDNSLPEGRVLIVSDLERIGEGGYASVSDDGQAMIDSRAGKFQAVIKAQITDSSTQDSETTTETKTESTKTSSANTNEQKDNTGNADTNEQKDNTETESFFGIDPPDWFTDGEQIISDVLKGISDLFGNDEE